MLDQTGYAVATVNWIRLSLGARSNSSVVFSCHSLTVDGMQLDTIPAIKTFWHPEFVPLWHKVLLLEGDISAHDVIRAHLQHILTTKELTRFSPRSLRDHTLESIHKLLDFKLKKGNDYELCNRQIQHLTETPSN